MNDTSRPRTLRVLFVCMGNICRSPAAEAIEGPKGEPRPLLREGAILGRGLREGERLVVYPGDRVRDGVRVRPLVIAGG